MALRHTLRLWGLRVSRAVRTGARRHVDVPLGCRRTCLFTRRPAQRGQSAGRCERGSM